MNTFIFKALCKWGFSHLIFSLYFHREPKSSLERRFYWNSYLWKALLQFFFCCRQICLSLLKITLDDSTHYLALEFIVLLRILANKIFKNNLTAWDGRLLAYCLISQGLSKPFSTKAIKLEDISIHSIKWHNRDYIRNNICHARQKEVSKYRQSSDSFVLDCQRQTT